MLEAIGRFDRDITRALRSFADAHPWLTAPVIVMTALAIFGSAASVVLLCRARPRLRGPVAAVAAVIVAYAGSDAAGLTWYRPRPFIAMQVSPLYPHSANSSFPSGTVAVGALAGAVSAAVTWKVSGLGWPRARLAAADRYAARLGARIRYSGEDSPAS